MTMPMMPQGDPEKPLHLQQTPERWQEIFQQALADHHANPNDAEALQAIRDSAAALNEYERQGIAPSTGELLKAEGKGLAQFPGQMAGGIGQLLDDIGNREFTKAGTGIVQGAMHGIAGLAKLPATALKAGANAALPGDPYQLPGHDEMLQQAEDYGSSTGMVGAMALPGQIKAGVNKVRGMPTVADVAPKGPVEGIPRTPDVLGRSPADAAKAEFMTEDPYGLNDFKPTAENLPNRSAEFQTRNQAPHDILSPDEYSTTKPLTPEELNNILSDIIKPSKAPTSKAAKPSIEPELSTDPIDNMLSNTTKSSANVLNILSMAPGGIGRLAKIAGGKSAEAGKAALTAALKSTIFSGMNPVPDSTKVR